MISRFLRPVTRGTFRKGDVGGGKPSGKGKSDEETVLMKEFHEAIKPFIRSPNKVRVPEEPGARARVIKFSQLAIKSRHEKDRNVARMLRCRDRAINELPPDLRRAVLVEDHRVLPPYRLLTLTPPYEFSDIPPHTS